LHQSSKSVRFSRYMKKSGFLFIAIFYQTLLYAQQDIAEKLENTAFMTGEELHYEVKYGLIKGGEATLTVGLEHVGEDWLYYSRAEARIAGLPAKLFTIRDIYESYFYVENGLPIKSIRNIHEEGYKEFDEVLFFREQNKVRNLKNQFFDVPPQTHDVLSAFYFARRFLFKENLQPEDTLPFTIFLDKQVLVFKIKYQKKEKVKTAFGKIDAMKFVAVIEGSSPFKKEEDMEVWFTDDLNYIPLRISADLPIGSLKCVLISYSGLKNAEGRLP